MNWFGQHLLGLVGALLAVPRPEDDRHEAMALFAGRGNEVVTRIAHEAGLHAVGILHLAQQAVAIAQIAFADLDRILREVMRVLGVLLEQGLDENGEIARGRNLQGMEQAIWD